MPPGTFVSDGILFTVSSLRHLSLPAWLSFGASPNSAFCRTNCVHHCRTDRDILLDKSLYELLFLEVPESLVIHLKNRVKFQDFLVVRLAVILKISVDMCNYRSKTVPISNIRYLLQIPRRKVCIRQFQQYVTSARNRQLFYVRQPAYPVLDSNFCSEQNITAALVRLNKLVKSTLPLVR